MSEISSPYIASVVDYGSVDGLTATVLPYFKKGSLGGRTFSLDFLKSVVIPSINEGLNDLHKSGIIHKDIKPSNLMLSDDEKTVRIIDFGISSVLAGDVSLIRTATGMTLGYSAPETFSGTYLKDSDYYSFGITLYEIFTGVHPFSQTGGDDMAAAASLMKIPFSDDFPYELKSLILGLTYKDLTYRNDESNPNRRWGYSEVSDWLDGENLPVPGENVGSLEKQKSGTEKDRCRFSSSYKFSRREIDNLEELIEAFGLNWKDGMKHVGRGLLSEFLKREGEQELACHVMDCEEAGVSDLTYFRLLFELSGGSGKLYWHSACYKDLQEFAVALIAFVSYADRAAREPAEELYEVITLYCRDDPKQSEILGLVGRYISSLGESNGLVSLLNLCLFMWNGNPDILVRYRFAGSRSFENFSALSEYLSNSQNTDGEIFDFLRQNYRLLVNCRYLYSEDAASVFRKFDQKITDLIFKNRFDVKYEDLCAMYSVSDLKNKGVFTVDSMLCTLSQVRTAMAGKKFAMLRLNVLPPRFFSDYEEKTPDFAISLSPEVTDLSRMFSGCKSLVSLPKFDTSHVKDMSEMFKDCTSLQFVPNFDTSKVESMRFMFSGCGELPSIPEFNVHPSVDIRGIANGCGRIVFSGTLPAFLSGHSRSEIFASSDSEDQYLYPGESSYFDFGITSSDEDYIETVFSDCVLLQRNTRTLVLKQGGASDLDREYRIREALLNVANSYGRVRISSYSGVVLFNALVQNLDRIDFNVTVDDTVTSLAGMFEGCWSLESIPLFDTSRVNDMSRMFFGCSSITTVPPFNTSSLVKAVSMFENCSLLAELPYMDTSKTEYMDRMFCNCYKLPYEMNFSRQSLKSAVDMYAGCFALSLPNDRYYVFGTEGNRRYYSISQGISEGTVIPEYNIHRGTGDGLTLMSVLKFILAFFIIMIIVGACSGMR